ncbi:uncharacterized protein LOC123878151 isoform X2 [Maniola jurtina]|uniref:uncharacterized protein LOC123878151 isoform X2 n=1 Tax=Maniola jurtina TaxID=191418 RepID=UPI001E68E0C9|nr:uncharacterized protein LOC123878151 isoform X2 [Maniola jurtina]
MKSFVLFVLVSSCYVYGRYDGTFAKLLARRKRDAAGALEIRTNHAQPIHADVRNDHTGVDKITFQVTPPRDTIYQDKSLRKSLPRTTGLDIVRAVSRLVTLVALVFTVVEFYPLAQQLYYTVYDFMYPK